MHNWRYCINGGVTSPKRKLWWIMKVNQGFNFLQNNIFETFQQNERASNQSILSRVAFGYRRNSSNPPDVRDLTRGNTKFEVVTNGGWKRKNAQWFKINLESLSGPEDLVALINRIFISNTWRRIQWKWVGEHVGEVWARELLISSLNINLYFMRTFGQPLGNLPHISACFLSQ